VTIKKNGVRRSVREGGDHAGIKFSIDTSHRDVIHDLCWDYYGRRLATCSSDHTIKIWDKKDGEWKFTQEIPAHSSSIRRVCWAHPEFGQVIASCASDTRVWIFEEVPVGEGRKKQFQRRGKILDSKGQIRDCEFAPRHLGLKIASASIDGKVQIHESPSIGLDTWEINSQFQVDESAYCLSWNPCRFDPVMLAVGSNIGAKVYIQKRKRTWEPLVTLWSGGRVLGISWAANMGRSYHLIAHTNGRFVRIFKLYLDRNKAEEYDVEPPQGLEPHQEIWRVKWNITGTILAACGDDGKRIMAWQKVEDKWIYFTPTLTPLTEIKE